LAALYLIRKVQQWIRNITVLAVWVLDQVGRHPYGDIKRMSGKKTEEMAVEEMEDVSIKAYGLLFWKHGRHMMRRTRAISLSTNRPSAPNG
jgi:hypothetical protein